jgi:negative regulator of sigma E activity
MLQEAEDAARSFQSSVRQWVLSLARLLPVCSMQCVCDSCSVGVQSITATKLTTMPAVHTPSLQICSQAPAKSEVMHRLPD